MKILLAIDESKFSEEAVKTVVAQFVPAKTEVHVLHVLQPIAFTAPPQMAAGYAPELAALEKQGRELVERAVQTLRGAGFKPDAAVEKGDIREKIIDAAAAWHADLIVIGSHGRRGVQRFLLGSVAEFVARHAPCSVEIVRLAAGR